MQETVSFFFAVGQSLCNLSDKLLPSYLGLSIGVQIKDRKSQVDDSRRFAFVSGWLASIILPILLHDHQNAECSSLDVKDSTVSLSLANDGQLPEVS